MKEQEHGGIHRTLKTKNKTILCVSLKMVTHPAAICIVMIWNNDNIPSELGVPNFETPIYIYMYEIYIYV